MGAVRRFFGSSMLWHGVISLVPMSLLVVFIIIVNTQKSQEEDFRRANVVVYSGSTVATNLELFFQQKLSYIQATNNAIAKGIWSDRTDVTQFRRFILPTLLSHKHFVGCFMTNDDGTQFGVHYANYDSTSRDVIVVTDQTLLTESGDTPVVRRTTIPSIASRTANDPSVAWNTWVYVSAGNRQNPKAPRTAQLTPVIWPVAMLSTAYAPTGVKWFYPGQLPTLDSTSLSLAIRSAFPELSNLNPAVQVVTRGTLRKDVLAAATARPSTVEFLIVEAGTLRIFVDSRNQSAAGGVLTGTDSQFGYAATTIVLDSTLRLRIGFAMVPVNGKFLKATPLNISFGQLGDLVLLTSDSSLDTALARSNVAQIQDTVESVFSKVPRAIFGVGQIFLGREIRDFSDVGQASTRLIPYFHAVSDVLETLTVCFSDTYATTSQGDGPILVLPCYELTLSPNGTDIDVAFWPGNTSSLGRRYSPGLDSDTQRQRYSYVTFSPNDYSTLFPPVPTSSNPTSTLTPPIGYVGGPPFQPGTASDPFMSMMFTVSWPVGSHNSSRSYDFSTFKFVFNPQHLNDILIDCDLSFNDGNVVVIDRQGKVVATQNRTSSPIGAVTSPGYSEWPLTLSVADLEYLMTNLGQKAYVNATLTSVGAGIDAGVFVSLFRIYQPLPAADYASAGLYLLIAAKETIGKSEHTTKRQVQTLIGLVLFAIFIFIVHIIHYILQIQSIQRIRDVLILAASLQLTEEKELQIRKQTCYSNYDLDSLQNHAFEICHQIRMYQGLIPSETQSVIRDTATREGVGAEGKRRLKQSFDEKEICLVSVHCANPAFFSKEICRHMQDAARDHSGTWYRIGVSSNGQQDCLVAQAYWGSATADSIHKAWKYALQLESGLDIQPISTSATGKPGLPIVLITIVVAPAYLGSLGPISAEVTSNFKQFVLNGPAETLCSTLFDCFMQEGRSAKLVIMTDGSSADRAPAEVRALGDFSSVSNNCPGGALMLNSRRNM